MEDLNLLNEMNEIGYLDCKEGCKDWKVLLELLNLGFCQYSGTSSCKRFILTEKGKEIVKEFSTI